MIIKVYKCQWNRKKNFIVINVIIPVFTNLIGFNILLQKNIMISPENLDLIKHWNLNVNYVHSRPLIRLHILTKHSGPERRKKEFKYYCEKCDFGTFTQILFTRHLEAKNIFQIIKMTSHKSEDLKISVVE
jgi:hypothetical protein